MSLLVKRHMTHTSGCYCSFQYSWWWAQKVSETWKCTFSC